MQYLKEKLEGTYERMEKEKRSLKEKDNFTLQNGLYMVSQVKIWRKKRVTSIILQADIQSLSQPALNITVGSKGFIFGLLPILC